MINVLSQRLKRKIAHLIIVSILGQSVFFTNVFAAQSRSWSEDLDKVHNNVDQLQEKMITLEGMLKAQQLMMLRMIAASSGTAHVAKKEHDRAKQLYTDAKKELINGEMKEKIKGLGLDSDVKSIIELYDRLQDKDLSASEIAKIQSEIEKHSHKFKKKDEEVNKNYQKQIRDIKKSCKKSIGWVDILENKSCSVSQIQGFIKTAEKTFTAVSSSIKDSDFPTKSNKDINKFILNNLSPEANSFAMSLVPANCLPDCINDKKAFSDAQRDKASMDFVKVQMAAMSSQLMTMALSSGNPYLIAAAVALMILMAIFEDGGGDGDKDKDTGEGGEGQVKDEQNEDSNPNETNTTEDKNTSTTGIVGSGEKFDSIDKNIERGSVSISGGFKTGYKIIDGQNSSRIKVPNAIYEKDGSKPIQSSNNILEFCSASATSTQTTLKLLVILNNKKVILKLVRESDGAPKITNVGILEGNNKCRG